MNSTGEGDNNRDTSKFIRGSALLFLGRLFSIIIKLFPQILIVRYLAKADYGAFAYALNMVEIGIILAVLALDSTASRFAPIYDEHEDYDSLFGFIVMSLATIMGLSLTIISVFYATQGFIGERLINDPLSLSLLLILIWMAPLGALDNWFQSMFAAFTSVRAIFFRRYILWPILQLIIVVLVILARADAYWLAAGYLLGGAIGTLTYGSMFISLFRRKGLLQKFNWNTIRFDPREIYGFSIPMFFTGIVLILRSQSAIVFLEFFKGTIAVAEYRAVQPVVKLNSMVYSSFVFLYLPLAARLFAKRDEEGINDLYWRTTAWISIATFPVFLVSFSLAQPVVVLLFGDQYSSSASIMAVLAFAYYLNAVMGFNKDTLRAYKKIRYLLFVDIMVMFTALISFLVLIPQLGALGAAIAFTAAMVVNNLLYHIGLIRYIGVRSFDWSYIRIYLMIIGGSVGLLLIQLIFSPSLFIGVPLAALLSLALLRLNAAKLQVGEMFPELLKVPVLRKLIE